MSIPATTLVADLYTVAKFFIKLFLLRLTVFFRSSSSSAPPPSSSAQPTTTTLLNFLNEKYPPTHYYSSDDDEEECSVCLRDFGKGDAVRKLGCDHTFHVDCVDRWFDQELANYEMKGIDFVVTCPVCRSGVSPPPQQHQRRRRGEGHVGSTREDDRLEWGQQQLGILLASLRGDSSS
ncbi:E3 ubiquitin-protein ligase RHA2B [Linum grandiflorum]